MCRWRSATTAIPSARGSSARLPGVEDQCRLEDDGFKSSDFIVVEAGEHPQALWVGVRRVYYGTELSREPVVQVCLQDTYMSGSLRGPVFITPQVWDELAEAVRWRLAAGKPRWKRLLRRR